MFRVQIDHNVIIGGLPKYMPCWAEDMGRVGSVMGERLLKRRLRQSMTKSLDVCVRSIGETALRSGSRNRQTFVIVIDF